MHAPNNQKTRRKIMKPRILVTCSLVLLALFAHPAFAGNLTVQMTGRVVTVNDPSNLLGSKVNLGQTVTGSYSYETTVPDQAPANPELGIYKPASGQGNISLSVGPYTFDSDPVALPWIYEVAVGASPIYPDNFVVQSGSNKPMANGVQVLLMRVELKESSITASSTDALPTTAPDTARFAHRRVSILGNSPTGASFFILVDIETLTVAPAVSASKVISPASSSFVRFQQISPAVFLPGTQPLLNFSASVDGIPLPSFFLTQCSSFQFTPQGRQVLTCPNVIPLLHSGKNIVEWRVNMLDGSTVSDKVEWEIVD
jgi:hypothetical protein